MHTYLKMYDVRRQTLDSRLEEKQLNLLNRQQSFFLTPHTKKHAYSHVLLIECCD